MGATTSKLPKCPLSNLTAPVEAPVHELDRRVKSKPEPGNSPHTDLDPDKELAPGDAASFDATVGKEGELGSPPRASIFLFL